MTPVKLSNATRTVGKPKEWIEELDGPCISLDVYDFVDELTGVNFMRTGWIIGQEDLERLHKGGLLWLDIAGTTFPVIRIGTSE